LEEWIHIISWNSDFQALTKMFTIAEFRIIFCDHSRASRGVSVKNWLIKVLNYEEFQWSILLSKNVKIMKYYSIISIEILKGKIISLLTHFSRSLVFLSLATDRWKLESCTSLSEIKSYSSKRCATILQF
jgi:hypothetical protein